MLTALILAGGSAGVYNPPYNSAEGFVAAGLQKAVSEQFSGCPGCVSLGA